MRTLESEYSYSQSDDAIEAERHPARSSIFSAARKQSFIRRLRRKLYFYLLPRNNMPPPFDTVKSKKACLRSHFNVLVREDIYRDWFIAL